MVINVCVAVATFGREVRGGMYCVSGRGFDHDLERWEVRATARTVSMEYVILDGPVVGSWSS